MVSETEKSALCSNVGTRGEKRSKTVSVLILLYNKSLCHESIWESGSIASQYLSSVLDGSEFG
jgi:hypothetical protein